MANKNGKTLITFDANSTITYEIHGDVFKFLNIPYSPRKSFVQFSKDFYFWFPKMSNKGVKDDDWDNTISNNGHTIMQKAKNSGSIIKDVKTNKAVAVFGQVKIQKETVYKFFGVYIAKRYDKTKIEYKMVSDKFSIFI